MPLRQSLWIRTLGPHGGSAPGCHMTTFLIDGETALDAGALTDTLSLSAQRRLDRVVLTHAHLDHTASLPFLAENLYGRGRPLEIAAPPAVIATLRRHVFNDVVWPDFTRLPSPAKPTLRYRPVAVARPFRAGNLTLMALPVTHLGPAYGYVVSKPGRAVLFSGDTMPTRRIWAHARRIQNLKAVFLEVSFSDEQADVARASCHLTPRLLPGELAKLPPRVPVYLYHAKPPSLPRIRRELAALGIARLRLLDSQRTLRF